MAKKNKKSFRTDKKSDSARKAKPSGYRYNIHDKNHPKYYSRPTASEIKKHLAGEGKWKDSIYYEARVERGDSNQSKKLKKGGSLKNQYKDRDAHDIWNSWTEEQRQHFMEDHAEVIHKKSIADTKEGINTDEYLNKEARFLPHAIHSTLIEHKNNGQYEKGGEVNGKYLDTISSEKKTKILKNIANHYGISESDAEEEVKDADAEMLYEYIANDNSLRMDVYNDFKKKMKKGGALDIYFPNSNLLLVGKGLDSNGNYVVKVSYPNQSAFSIQTNGVLRLTQNNLKSVDKISELTEEQLLQIEKEVVNYVSEHGSKKQKDKLKKYSGFNGEELKKGGSIKRSKAGIRQDKKIKAKKGGKRISADGNVYYEKRANRSDVDLRKKFKEGGELIDSRVDDVLNHYLMASLWSTANVDSENEEYLDANHSIEDFDPETKNKLREIVKKFLVENADELEKSELSDDQIGHDLWLTQNHHGAGFFDRGLPKDIEEKLEKSAQSFKSVDLYVGDDKKIHQMKSGGDVSGKTKTIHGISHSILREPIDKTGMLEIEFSHPLGTIYSDGKYGYVQSGYDWLRFSIVDLDYIKKKMKDGGGVSDDVVEYARGFKGLKNKDNAYKIVKSELIGVAVLKNGDIEEEDSEYNIDYRAFDDNETKDFVSEINEIFGEKANDVSPIKSMIKNIKADGGDLDNNITLKKGGVIPKGEFEVTRGVDGLVIEADSVEGVINGELAMQGKIKVSLLRKLLGRDLSYTETIGKIKLRKPPFVSYFVEIKK